MSGILFNAFLSLALLSSLFVITAANPVHSVLFLILVFAGASGMLFVFQLEFIPLIFILVYVGAIAVLFLFVVMMLDIKVTSRTSDFFKYLPIGGFFGIFFASEIVRVLDVSLPSHSENFYENSFVFWAFAFDSIENIECLGFLLYTNFFVFFILAGLLLLISILGAIALTLDYNKSIKAQFLFKQLSRNVHSAVLLIK